jgi:hypothetical protein
LGETKDKIYSDEKKSEEYDVLTPIKKIVAESTLIDVHRRKSKIAIDDFMAQKHNLISGFSLLPISTDSIENGGYKA